MATCTAFLMVGHGHPHDGGLAGPVAMLRLSENSRPSWRVDGDAAVWIPTLDHTLEDGLLMAGLFVVRHPPLLELANRLVPDWRHHIELYGVSEADRAALRQQAQNGSGAWGVKVVAAIMAGSQLCGQVDAFRCYACEHEILR